jgi:hypothetical protein
MKSFKNKLGTTRKKNREKTGENFIAFLLFFK